MTIKLKRKEEEIYLLRQSINILKKYAHEIPRVDGFREVMGLPQILYDLIMNDIHYRDIQLRIRSFEEKTGIQPKIIRKWLKNYTMTEIEKSYNEETGKIKLKTLVRL